MENRRKVEQRAGALSELLSVVTDERIAAQSKRIEEVVAILDEAILEISKIAQEVIAVSGYTKNDSDSKSMEARAWIIITEV